MAHRLSITTVGFYERGKPGAGHKVLGNLDGAGAMALDFFEDHISSARWSDGKDRHSLKGDGQMVDTGHPDAVAGMMLAGEQGIEAEQFADDYDTPRPPRTRDIIEAPRVLVLAYMPPGRTTGYLVTHAYHNRYFKTGFLQSLPRAVVEAFNNHLTIETSAYLPPADVAALLGANEILSVDLTRYTRLDRYQPFTKTSVGTYSVRFEPVPGSAFDVEELQRAAVDEEARNEMLRVEGLRFSQIAVRLRLGGHGRGRGGGGTTRTLVLGDENAEWISEDVTARVGDSAQPDPDLLVREALELLSRENLLRDL